jgi:hypothetical protein
MTLTSSRKTYLLDAAADAEGDLALEMFSFRIASKDLPGANKCISCAERRAVLALSFDEVRPQSQRHYLIHTS